MYRPQLSYRAAPPGFEDVDFTHYFDSTNTPRLNNATLANGGLVLDIPLVLQSDAPFYWRAWQIVGLNGANPIVSVQFRDPSNNYLSNTFVPLDLIATPNFNDPQFGFDSVTLEPEIKCIGGAPILLNISNNSGATQDITKVRISLIGVKRRLSKGVKCAA